MAAANISIDINNGAKIAPQRHDENVNQRKRAAAYHEAAREK